MGTFTKFAQAYRRLSRVLICFLAGAALLPLILMISLLSQWAGGLEARYGARLPLTIGPVLVAVGYALLAVPGIGSS